MSMYQELRLYWTACLEGSFFDEFDTSEQLAELVVAAARVGEDLDAIQAHQDMGT